MTKELTFAHEPKGNELSVTQVDDLCRKHSAFSTRNETDTTHSCSDKFLGDQLLSVHQQTKAGACPHLSCHFRGSPLEVGAAQHPL